MDSLLSFIQSQQVESFRSFLSGQQSEPNTTTSPPLARRISGTPSLPLPPSLQQQQSTISSRLSSTMRGGGGGTTIIASGTSYSNQNRRQGRNDYDWPSRAHCQKLRQANQSPLAGKLGYSAQLSNTLASHVAGVQVCTKAKQA